MQTRFDFCFLGVRSAVLDGNKSEISFVFAGHTIFQVGVVVTGTLMGQR